MAKKILNIKIRKQQVFDYIKEYIHNNSYAPSLSEIGQHFEISKTRAEYIIKKLVEDGKIIKTSDKVRNIEMK